MTKQTYASNVSNVDVYGNEHSKKTENRMENTIDYTIDTTKDRMYLEETKRRVTFADDAKNQESDDKLKLNMQNNQRKKEISDENEVSTGNDNLKKLEFKEKIKMIDEQLKEQKTKENQSEQLNQTYDNNDNNDNNNYDSNNNNNGYNDNIVEKQAVYEQRHQRRRNCRCISRFSHGILRSFGLSKKGVEHVQAVFGK